MEVSDSQSVKTRRIRLFLLADQSLFRTSLGSLLAREPDFELAGEGVVGAETLELLKGTPADVVLIESDSDTSRAGELVSAAIRGGLTGKVIVLTGILDASASARALKLGASGIFLKSDSADRLMHAIRAVAMGQLWIDPRIIRMFADRYPVEQRIDSDGLTDREQKVLLGIMGGLSNRRIGEGLNLSESSVKAVVQQLFEKTGVRTRSQLVRIGMTRSLPPVSTSASARAHTSAAVDHPITYS